MPAVDERGRPIKASRVPKVKRKPTYNQQIRSGKVAGPPAPKPSRALSPDQADRMRSPQQQARDKAAVAKAVKEARIRALKKQNRGSGVRAVKRIAGTSGHEREGGTVSKVIAMDPRMKALGLLPGRLGEFHRNVPKDLAEIAITTPSSLYALGKTALTHPEKLPAELVKPYVELAKHPVETFTERPVSTYLMVAPGVKVPARGAGRIAAATGKRSLAKPAATLEGTSLRAQRWQSPDVLERAVAPVRVPKGRRPKGPEITEKELHQRVDEAYDAGQLHKQAVVSSAAKKANRDFGHLPKAERDAAIENKLSGARGGAGHQVRRRFAEEFGSHWQVTKTGALIKPKNPAENSGVLHASKADAERVAARVPFEAKLFEVGSTDGTTSYAVVPKQAAEHWGHHEKVGTKGSTGAVALRAGTRQFRKTVLPLSTKWLGGQIVEAALRNAVMGAGPTSYIRARRILNQLPKAERDELINRTTQTGQFNISGPAGEFARGQKPTLGEEFAGTGFAAPAEVATRIGAKPGLRHAREGYRRYSEFIFNDVNGTIEKLAKTAQLGKAVKQSPLMERRMLGLSHKAVDEAAAGLRNTSTQAELGRALDRAYGQYSKFSPHMREGILHWTPFIPWFLNMGRFLGSVMPKDHPVLTALAADIGMAEEEWRVKNRLSFHGKEHVPGFLLGSAPKGEKYVPLARFGPFLPADPVEAAGGQILPAFQSALMNMAGVDWTGKELKGSAGAPAGRAANAALSLAEAMIPGVSQAGRISGLSEHYVRGKAAKPSVVQGKDIPQAVLDLLNPVKPIGTSDTKKRKKKAAGGDWYGSSGSGGSSGGDWFSGM